MPTLTSTPPTQGSNISFAVTEDHDVLSWGGGGMGASGHRVAVDYRNEEDSLSYLEPRPIRDLVGEEINQVGANRCLTREPFVRSLLLNLIVPPPVPAAGEREVENVESCAS